MEPPDFRNLTFADLKATLQGKRLAALSAWRQFGPGTTREIAEQSGIDLLTFRPRTTELYQLGFLALVEPEPAEGHSNHRKPPLNDRSATAQRAPHEGTYRALSDAETLALFRLRQSEQSKDPQLALSI